MTRAVIVDAVGLIVAAIVMLCALQFLMAGQFTLSCDLDRDRAVTITDGHDRWFTCDWRGI